MPFVPAAETAQFNIRGTLHGEQVENTLYFANGDGWDSAQLATFGSYLLDWYTTNVRAYLSTGFVLREVYAVDLSAQDGPSATVTVENDPGGPLGADALPGNVALCVSFRTAFRGRSRRGRNYISGFVETQVSANGISSGVVNAIVAGYQELLSIGTYPSIQWVVVSRYQNKVQRTNALVTPVTAVLAVDNYVDSMRRRLPGRGR